MNFFKKLFRKQKLGTGEGQIFKDGIKTLAFEVYRGISVLHIVQLKDENLQHKYMFYTSIDTGDKREDTLHSGVAQDLEQSRTRAIGDIDKLTD